MGFISGICFICGEAKKVRLRKSNNEYTCQKCYLEKLIPKEMCSICKELKNVQTRDIFMKPICRSCYKQPKEICFVCGKYEISQARDKNGKSICPKCHGRPIEVCIRCNKLEEVSTRDKNHNPICKNCSKPKDICHICGNFSVVAYRDENKNSFCPNCRTKIRLKTNEKFHTISILRKRFRKALNFYSKTGKVKDSDEYGINYLDIFNHLGPCPGNMEDFHIDHIFPLTAFDFNNPEQIKLAFLPENHQWLKKEDNLSKNDKYNKEEFLKYLANHMGEK